jgi:hypothetical protein
MHHDRITHVLLYHQQCGCMSRALALSTLTCQLCALDPTLDQEG